MGKLLFAGLGLTVALLALGPSPVTAQQPPATPAPIPTASVSPSPSPSPSISPSPTPMPSETPLPSPLPSGAPTPTPSISPLPTPLPTPLVLPDDAPPQILAVRLSDPVFHTGELVTGTIITSTNVAAVEIRLMGRSHRIPREDFGVFQMSYTIPSVPFWLRKTYTAQVVAINSTGLQAEQDVTVSLR